METTYTSGRRRRWKGIVVPLDASVAASIFDVEMSSNGSNDSPPPPPHLLPDLGLIVSEWQQVDVSRFTISQDL